jgi:hypothetical protein
MKNYPTSRKKIAVILVFILSILSILLFYKDDNYSWNQSSLNSSVTISKAKNLFIDSHVVEYLENDNFAVALRQVSTSYECSEGTIATEITNKFEYWLSDKNKINLEGPLTYQTFKNRLLELKIFDKFKITPEEFIIAKYNKNIVRLRYCSEPKEI